MATTYTIRLNLGGNIIQRLTQAEQIINRINTRAGLMGAGIGGVGGGIAGGRMSGYGYATAPFLIPPGRQGGLGGGSAGGSSSSGRTGGGYGRFPFIPPGARPFAETFYRRTRAFGSGQNREQFMGRYNEAFRQLQRFQNEFTRNIFSISGLRRNFGNFVGVLGSFGSAINGAIPVLRGVTAGLGTVIGIRGANALYGGIAYSVGSRTLNGQNVSEAITNQLQMNMAQRGLGPDYVRALNNATETAAAFGYSRAGIISATNVLSGLDTGNGPMGVESASNLARIIGKISQLGSRPYDIVSLNTQQLLSTSSPNMRDIREMLNAAPILATFAQQEMRRRGLPVGDVREFYRDRNNIIAGYEWLDQQVQPPAAARIRGRQTLRRQDFWMRTTERLEPFWEDVGYATNNLYDAFDRLVDRFMNRYNSEEMRRKFDGMVSGVEGIVDGLISALGGIGTALDTLNTYSNTAAFTVGGGLMGGRRGAGIGLLAGLTVDAVSSAWNTDVPRRDVANMRTGKFVYDEFLSQFNRENPGALQRIYTSGGFTREVYEELMELATNRASQFEEETDRNQLGYRDASGREYMFGGRQWRRAGGSWLMGAGENRFSEEALRWAVGQQALQGNGPVVYNDFAEYLRSLLPGDGTATGLGAGQGDTEQIENLTRGSRALTINFNHAIVDMTNNINSTDPEGIIREMGQYIEDYTSRGIMIALHNATSVL